MGVSNAVKINFKLKVFKVKIVNLVQTININNQTT